MFDEHRAAIAFVDLARSVVKRAIRDDFARTIRQRNCSISRDNRASDRHDRRIPLAGNPKRFGYFYTIMTAPPRARFKAVVEALGDHTHFGAYSGFYSHHFFLCLGVRNLVAKHARVSLFYGQFLPDIAKSAAEYLRGV
jgi:hypothetical protein